MAGNSGYNWTDCLSAHKSGSLQGNAKRPEYYNAISVVKPLHKLQELNSMLDWNVHNSTQPFGSR